MGTKLISIEVNSKTSSIRALGAHIVWRNSNTVRYFRIVLNLWKKQVIVELFRKDKSLNRLAEVHNIGDLKNGN